MATLFTIIDSANITDEEVTTAQLTSPAGKDSGDFQAGMMKDESETAEGIDLAADKYTEIEYCIQAEAAAEIGETYEFRLTCPTSYYSVGADCVLYHAYWDGTATNHASSGSDHDGTVVGASFGTYGLTFDGTDDKVTAGNLTEINNLSEMTIYIWKAWTNDNASLDYCISRGDASVYVGMADYSSSYGLVMPGFGHTTAATSTVWQMWALVFNGAGALNADRLKIYLNTSSQAITFDINIPAVTPTIANALFTVGTFRDGSSYPWKGIIGEVLVFNEAKDSTALTDYYNATKSRYGL